MDVILYSKIKKNTDNIDDLEQIVSDGLELVTDESKNRLDTSAVTIKHYIAANGTIYENNSYSYTDYIAVKPGDKISIYQEQSTNSWIKRKPRFLCAYDASKTVLSGEGKDSGFEDDFTVGANTYFVRISCTTGYIADAKSMIFINDTNTPTTYYPYETTQHYVAKEAFIKDAVDDYMENIDFYSVIGPIPAKNRIAVRATADTLTDGETLTACQNIDNKKNDTLIFYAEIGNTFDSVIVGHGYDMAYGSYLVLDDTNLTTYYGQSQYFQHAHGLTLSHFIGIEVKKTQTGRADITISTDGGEYSVASGSIAWEGSKGTVFATSDGSTLTNVSLCNVFNDFQENVFIFGDSYVGISDTARWPRYLINDGYTKNAIFGYGGATSEAEKLVFDNVIAMAKPNYVVWALGMNNPDSSSAINASYKEVLDSVIATCEANGIVPIIATIPNVPSANHTFKNTYVKSLGCRIVDFASAVGANEAESTWWSGLLSNDNVHPSAEGAKALYRRFVADVPEATKT